MFYFLSFLWFLRTTKAVLFWFYLWQLKEYHIGRFLDHFRTEKGKQLVIGGFNIFKLFLLLIFPFYPVFVLGIVLLVYIFEAFKVLLDFSKRRFKMPVLTRKTIFLVLTGLLVEFVIVFFIFSYVENLRSFAFWLLLFDVLMPVIASFIVLLLQPFTVLLRNQIIKKAKEKRKKFDKLLVIGITGSYGKTSTKEFLADMLSLNYKVLKTKEHQNSEVGIAQCILNDLKEEHEVFVCEMGAYNRGGIKLLCDITQPKIGILTGINEQHMATFGSQENIIKGKYELIESLPSDGLAFFNAKNKYCLELYDKTKVKKFLYGQEAEFPGQENILGAMAVAKELGVPEQALLKYRATISQMPGREIKIGINGLTFIDSTYSANPDGVMANLEYLKRFSGKRVIVMPCLIELGSASKDVHLRIGKKIGEICDLAIITTKERFKEVKEGAGEKAVFIPDTKDIFEKIKSFCKGEDVVLLQSRVPRSLLKKLL